MVLAFATSAVGSGVTGCNSNAKSSVVMRMDIIFVDRTPIFDVSKQKGTWTEINSTWYEIVWVAGKGSVGMTMVQNWHPIYVLWNETDAYRNWAKKALIDDPVVLDPYQNITYGNGPPVEPSWNGWLVADMVLYITGVMIS